MGVEIKFDSDEISAIASKIGRLLGDTDQYNKDYIKKYIGLNIFSSRTGRFTGLRDRLKIQSEEADKVIESFTLFHSILPQYVAAIENVDADLVNKLPEYEPPILYKPGSISQINLSTFTKASVGSNREDILEVINSKPDMWEMVQKYSSDYGVDPYLIVAIMMEESGCRGSDKVNAGGAIGYMQLQYSVHKYATRTAYNYNTGEYDIVKATDDVLKNDESNIQYGIMYFRELLDKYNCNPMLAIQAYNFGPGAVDEVVRKYAKQSGLTYSDVVNSPDNMGWTKYLDDYASWHNKSSHGNDNYVYDVLTFVANDNITIISGDSLTGGVS